MPRCSPVTCRRPGCRPSTPPEHSGSSIDRPGTPSRATSCSAPVGRTVPARRHCYALAAVLSPTSLRLVGWRSPWTVSYTHLRAHETPEHLVCRLLLEKKKTHTI